MSTKPTGLKAAISGLPKRSEPQPAPTALPADEDGRDQKRQTLYLPLGVHDQLREAAFAKRISMQEIIRQGLDLWFAQEGMPSWDEAKKRG